MKLHHSALLLAAVLTSVSRLALSVPVVRDVEVTDLQDYPHSHDHSTLARRQAPHKELYKKDEDSLYADLWKETTALVPRAFPGRLGGLPGQRGPPPAPLPPPGPLPGTTPGGNRWVGSVAPKRVDSPEREPVPETAADWKEIPYDVSPGNGARMYRDSEKEKAPKDGPAAMKSLENKAGIGGTYLMNLAATLERDGPDVTKHSDFFDNTPEGYRIVSSGFIEYNRPLDPALVQPLKLFSSQDLGFSTKNMPPGTRMKTITIKNKDGATINSGTYDEEGRFIYYQDAFADNVPKDNPVPVWELSMQSFLHVAKGDKAKNLRVAFLTSIRNGEFQDVIWKCYNDKKQPFTQILTFDRQRDPEQFNMIMSTPNFGSKLRAYGDHHKAIGNKVPKKIIVIPRQAQRTKDGEQIEDAELNVAIVLEKYERE